LVAPIALPAPRPPLRLMHNAHTMHPRKCLILLPGFDGTGRLFGPLQQALDPHFETTVISYPTDRALSYDALCDHVSRALPGRDYAIVAESFSGPIALEIASRNPGGLKAVILSASFVKNPRPVLLQAARVLFELWHLRSKIPAWAIRAFLLGENAPPEHCCAIQDLLRIVDPNVIAFRLREVVKVNAIAALTQCPVPLFYLNATEDRILGKEALRTLAVARPDMTIFHVPGPHLLLQASPDLCARHIDIAVNSVDWSEG
jgi:pimeloyl-[acyl-carrier protein] methyl ester esterase